MYIHIRTYMYMYVYLGMTIYTFNMTCTMKYHMCSTKRKKAKTLDIMYSIIGAKGVTLYLHTCTVYT